MVPSYKFSYFLLQSNYYTTLIISTKFYLDIIATLHEYLEAKDLLQTEAEQSRLLLEVPTVIADEIIDLPCTTLDGTEKSESELPQNINSKLSSSPNDPDSPGSHYF